MGPRFAQNLDKTPIIVRKTDEGLDILNRRRDWPNAGRSNLFFTSYNTIGVDGVAEKGYLLAKKKAFSRFDPETSTF